MVPTDSIQTKLDNWPELENTLAKMYQDDDRARTRIALLENEQESVDDRLCFGATDFGNQARKSVASVDMLENLRDVTQLLDKSTRSDQSVSHKTDFVLLLGPDIEDKAYEGRVDMLDALTGGSKSIQGLVRSTKLNGKPLVFSCMTDEIEQTHDPEVVCAPLIKRRNFEAPNALTNHPAAAPAVNLARPSEAVRFRVREFPRISDADQEAEDRTLGVKVLADVVEALIGAAYIDSGFRAARECTNVFLPEISAIVPQFPERESAKSNSPGDLEAETLIGYRFRDGLLLLEALINPSCSIDAKTESYQRLEFLGDAVLNVLISAFLSRCLPELSQGQMTRIKAALGNNNVLGYLCLHFSMDRNLVRIKTGPDHRPHEVRYCEKVPLWQFMRHHSPDVVHAHKNAGHTFEQCGAEIHKILSEGATYPWELLARLDPDNFYSDLVESVFGAVFNDSQGDLSECEKLFESLGLEYYAARMAEGTLDVMHPRDELQGLIGSSKLEIDVQPVCSGDERAIFVCSVRVEGTIIAEAQGYITEDEACMGGIQAAVAIFRSQQEGREH
ncbi:unnamed protein product [Alternaria alternata]